MLTSKIEEMRAARYEFYNEADIIICDSHSTVGSVPGGLKHFWKTGVSGGFSSAIGV